MKWIKKLSFLAFVFLIACSDEGVDMSKEPSFSMTSNGVIIEFDFIKNALYRENLIPGQNNQLQIEVSDSEVVYEEGKFTIFINDQDSIDSIDSYPNRKVVTLVINQEMPITKGTYSTAFVHGDYKIFLEPDGPFHKVLIHNSLSGEITLTKFNIKKGLVSGKFNFELRSPMGKSNVSAEGQFMNIPVTQIQ